MPTMLHKSQALPLLLSAPIRRFVRRDLSFVKMASDAIVLTKSSRSQLRRGYDYRLTNMTILLARGSVWVGGTSLT